jgi:uncharacterized protein YbjT (DUF2867 family)
MQRKGAGVTAIRTVTSKRLLILGATGGIGRAMVDQTLQRGHTLTAFVRSPEKLGRHGLGEIGSGHATVQSPA